MLNVGPIQRCNSAALSGLRAKSILNEFVFWIGNEKHCCRDIDSAKIRWRDGNGLLRK